MAGILANFLPIDTVSRMAMALQQCSKRIVMLRFIPTKVHGILDYLVSIVLIFLPTILGFSAHGNESWTMIIIGIVTILYSMFTRYELSFASLISMRGHLWLDFITGGFLAASPWLLNFAHRVYEPHLILGLAEIVVVLLSDSQPSNSPKPRLAPKNPS
jgi:hypothetical protein